MNGLVIGAVDGDRRLDRDFLSVALNGTNLCATLHRAFDTLTDIEKGVDDAVDLGFERILTSGRALKATQGIEVLQRTVQYASGRISIMAGSGVTQENAVRILRQTQVDELHASCSAHRAPVPTEGPEIELGFVPQSGTKVTDADRIATLRNSIDTYNRNFA